ncbi:hypothetical protein [Geomonas oryzisoli]|uniref:hypothetical protein n=1 Tax=Geomonas oryzisoli TaxID=2847992 RepID=UPI001EF06818|nr:hypothetical protein [Geomonas oryzisoli]
MKLPLVMVCGSIASLNVAVTAVLADTLLAPSAGLFAVTVGAAQAVCPLRTNIMPSSGNNHLQVLKVRILTIRSSSFNEDTT